jgi:hypothetical protein
MAGMKPINLETLIGPHSTSISDPFYRPTEHDLLEDYLKVVDLLTMSGENHLEQQIAKLKAQSDQADLYKQRCADIRRLSLDEKDDTIKRIQEQLHRIYKELYEAGIIQQISSGITKDSVTSKTEICIEVLVFDTRYR